MGSCKGLSGEALIALPARQEPTWEVHMPGLATDGELAALPRRLMGVPQERLLRGMVEALSQSGMPPTLAMPPPPRYFRIFRLGCPTAGWPVPGSQGK